MDEPRAKGLSLWLMPEGGARIRLAALIERLAVRLGTAPFVPHVTLLPGLPGPETQLIEQAHLLAAELEPLILDLSGIGGLDTPFRCLFLRVRPSPALREAHARACRHFGRAPQRSFDPHLSLVYGTLEAGRKADLIREVGREVGREVPPPALCRRLHVWRTEGRVGDWRELATLELGSGADI